MTNKIYTSAVGKKFNPDGSFREYPGLTIISKINKDTFESNLLKNWRDYFIELPFSEKFSFLPQDSFHMTVFELLNDHARIKELWSEYLKLNIKISEIDSFMKIKFDEIRKPGKIRMKVNGCKADDFVYVSLEPYSIEQYIELKIFRDILSEKTGVRKPDHDNYKYHITFAYKIIELVEEEELYIKKTLDKINDKIILEMPYIEFSSPELCFYNDMSEFLPDIKR